MPKKKTSIIWTMAREKLQEVVNRSESLADIFRHFGFSLHGYGYKVLRKRMDRDGIDYRHIRLGYDCNKGRKFEKTKAIPLEQVMVENSTYCRGSLKRRLIGNGILKNECSVCGQKAEWNGKRLVMVLDHINGVNNDHRRENLQLVCPNCNSQLETSNGRSRRRKRNCPKCGRVIGKTSTHCRHCSYKKLKVEMSDRPSREELEKMVKEMPMTRIGKKYGVSDNAVKKWCRSHGIELGNRLGIWTHRGTPINSEHK